MAKYTKIAADTFKKLQLNAGMLCTSFEPTTAEVVDSNILAATSGGVNFTATPSFTDFGEDIDNCPKNTRELKRLDSWEVKLSGTAVTVDTKTAKSFIGLADIAATKVTPRNDLKTDDFADLWWVGDYSDVNVDGGSSAKAGFIAIHMINALSTGGFQLQTADKEKGTFSFEYTAHYSMAAQDTVPFEVYVSPATPAAK
jgi:hypothetical protein